MQEDTGRSSLEVESTMEVFRRTAAIDFARASIELSGFKVFAENEVIASRFVAGEIGVAEFVRVPREPLAGR